MSSGLRTPIKVLLVEHQAIVRAGLRLLVESWPRLKVVGEAGIPVEAVAIASREKPDIILLSLDSGGVGLDCLPDLRSAAGEGRIIVLADIRDSEAHHRAMHLGAMGLVLKEQMPEELHRAILKVQSGEVWLDDKLMTSIITKMSRGGQADQKTSKQAKITSLSKREQQVIKLVCEGLKNQEIADRLFISLTTVRHHLTSIFSKLEISSRFELIIFAYRFKLVIPPG